MDADDAISPPASAPPSGRGAAVLARARAPRADELAAIAWLGTLASEERAVAVADLRVVNVEAGERLCRVGRPATYWFGVIDGFLKMSNDDAQDAPITFTGMPPGGWFGEGTLIKREVYRYNIQALRRSVVAGLGVESFHWLLERSLPFNHYITRQLNERLGQFIAAREIDRLTSPDERVARSLAAMFHPILYPGVGGLLRITQLELGYLVGLSRQRINEALSALRDAAAIRIEYGGVRVLDLEALRRYKAPSSPGGRGGLPTPDAT